MVGPLRHACEELKAFVNTILKLCDKKQVIK